ncbi:MAG: hypothetical protein PF689_01990 [Deltaproteobacteria bacterium]|jgi:hypothetical protein|nr:hypothetical protein [Deltaproteobacteria bacterium]
MSQFILIFTQIFFSQFTVNSSVGLGGINWRTNSDRPHINSNLSYTAGFKKKYLKSWWYGTDFTYNAYKGDNTYFKGPGLVSLKANVYYKKNLEYWQLFLGGGLGMNLFFTDRSIEHSEEGFSRGNYSLVMPGLSAGLELIMMQKFHSRLYIGINIYYSFAAYLGSCWEGPEQNCEDVDTFMNNWGIGLMIFFSFP